MINPENQIIIICPRRKTTHVRVTAFQKSVMLEYGHTTEATARHFIPREGNKENLTFEEHPELKVLFDGHAWNLFELQNLVAMIGIVDVETESVVAEVAV